MMESDLHSMVSWPVWQLSQRSRLSGQDLMSEVGIKSIGEDFDNMEDSILRISDGATDGRFWSGVPE